MKAGVARAARGVARVVAGGVARVVAGGAACVAACVAALSLAGCALPVAPGLAAVEPGGAAEGRLLAPGVRYRVASPWPASRVHVLRVDLREPGLALRLSPPEERGRRIDEMSDTALALASINVSFFDRRYTPRGLTVSDGRPWPEVMVPEASPLLACDARLRCVVELERTRALQPGWHTVVAGTPWLVRGGIARTAADDEGCRSLCAMTHPRTVVGLSEGGRQLLIVTVEGRRGEVAGVALAPLAAWLVSQGVQDAINLDGGGSSTLWLQGRAVMNRPLNEPAERVLANALHVLHAQPPPAGAAAAP